MRSGTIPLQTSPYLKIFILRSHPVHNVPRAIKIAKALPVIRQPFDAVRPATIPLQTFPYLKIFILRSQPLHNVPRRS